MLLIRIVSVVLLLCIASTIFCFSAQDSTKSAKQSGKITRKVCEKVYPKFKEKSEKEKDKIINSFHTPVRKAAHITLFFLFGACAYLSVITYTRLKLYLRIIISVGVSVLYAASDELHQLFVGGRGPQVTDVLIDTVGIIAATVILSIVFKSKKVKAFFGTEEK